ncbi:MAG: response regulator [Prochlorothrix sp.]|nr:response regulator [Prochlorothrix sp.]
MAISSKVGCSQLKTDRLYAFLFEPGFSTAAQVTELSGRGVGLDVVKSQIEGLKGNVSVISAAQKGTTFTLRLPLTLTITKLLIIQADQQPLALPSDSLEEIIIPKPEQYKQTGHNLFLHWRNQLIPSYNLQHLIQYSRPVSGTVTLPRLAALQAPPDWLLPLLIVRRGAYSFAVQVDRILTEQELVVKPFNPAIAPPPYLYGCTVLGDGRLVPVMDASLLVDYCHNSPILGSNSSIMGNSLAGQHVGQLPNPMPGPDWNQSSDSKSDPTSPSCSPSGSLLALPQPSLPQSAVSTSFPAIPHPSSPSTADIPLTILVVDDSAALRRTLALTLQKAGYHVLQARDGLEALEQLQKHQGVALVICDVEMPNMNGFEFLSQRRKQTNLAEIPVFMLTSRSNQKHRLLAQTLGATSYFTKPYLEQELLQALTQLFQSC